MSATTTCVDLAPKTYLVESKPDLSVACSKNLILDIPTDILMTILRSWLSLRDVAHLDSAMLNRAQRQIWLATLQKRVITLATVNVREKELLKLLWLNMRDAYCSKVAFRGCKVRDTAFTPELKQHWSVMAKHLKCLRFKDKCSVATPLMMELITSCPRLEELCINTRIMPNFSGEHLRQIVDMGSQLKTLFLSDAQDVSPSDWQYLAERCVNLTELNLENTRLSPLIVPAFLNNMKQLNKLTLKHCDVMELSRTHTIHVPVDVARTTPIEVTEILNPESTIEELKTVLDREILSIHTALYSIDLSHSRQLAAIILPYLIRRCVLVERLNVSFCSLTGPVFRLVAQFLHRLRTIFMPGCTIHDEVYVEMVSHCQLIETLVLGYSPYLTSVICEAMAKSLPNLKTFALWGNQQAFNKQSMETLVRSCRKIDKIALTHTGIDDDVLIALVEHCPITRIEINGCQRVRSTWMASLGTHCPMLTHFVAEQVNIQDVGLRELSKCTKLEYVNLSSCAELTNESLSLLLQSCPQISVLRLKECAWVNDQTLEIISSYGRSLQELDLSSNGAITAEGILNMIVKSQRLHRLHAVNCVNLKFLTDVALIERIRAAAANLRTVFVH